MIPRILHQMWIGPNVFPESCKGWQDSVRRHSEGFEVLLHGNDYLKRCVERDDFLRAAVGNVDWASISNRLRLWLMVDYGGGYLDIDVEAVRDLNEEFIKWEDKKLVICKQPADTAIFFAEKGLPAVFTCFQRKLTRAHNQAFELIGRTKEHDTFYVSPDLWETDSPNALYKHRQHMLRSWL